MNKNKKKALDLVLLQIEALHREKKTFFINWPDAIDELLIAEGFGTILTEFLEKEHCANTKTSSYHRDLTLLCEGITVKTFKNRSTEKHHIIVSVMGDSPDDDRMVEFSHSELKKNFRRTMDKVKRTLTA